jgi:hypothetical protein
MTTGRSVALERGTPVTALREPLKTVATPPVDAPPVVISDLGEKTRPMAAAPPPPSRSHRRLVKRRLVREQVLVALVLFTLLAVTVLLLCFEWLSASPVSSNAPPLFHLLGGSS